MAMITRLLLASCLLAAGGTALAQENQPRAVPDGFVLPGPAPTNAPAGAGSSGTAPPGTASSPAAPAPAPATAMPGPAPTVSGSTVGTQQFVLPTAGATQLLGTGAKHRWPFVQRKVEHVDAGQVWAGPPLEEAAAVPRDDAMRQFVATVAARRLALPDAVRTATDFVKALPAEQRIPAASAAFADLLKLLNDERRQIMRGIERYGAHQQALADRLRQENAALSDLRAKGDAKAAEAQEALLWDTRVFEERRRSLTYVCEVPTLIEQRLFALGRAMSGAL
jgi:hypothetical protein